MKTRPLISSTLMTLLGLYGLHGAAAASERIIVKFREEPAGRVQTFENRLQAASAIVQASTRSARWVRASDENTHIFRFESGTATDDRQAQLNRLRSDPRVQFAVVDRRVKSNATANDPFFRQQWALGTQSAGAARFSSAWDQYRGSAATVVAVVDTGVLPNHPDLAGRLVPGYDFISVSSIGNDGDGRDRNAADPGNWVSQSDLRTSEFEDCSESGSSWHGTFVAGLIAGNTQDGVGTAGANWNARILPIRALGKCGGYLSDVMDGARWAAGIPIPGVPNNPNPAAIINLSLGSAGACGQFEQNAINQINNRRAVVVVAAGNRAGALDSPASCANVIAVGAVDSDGLRASYSAIGTGTTLMAPGGDSNPMTGPANSGSTTPETDGWYYKVGTSFAAPMVSAALAMMHGIRGQISIADATDALRRSARPFPAAGGNPVCTADFGRGKCACTTSVCGAGLLDANALVSQVRAGALLANAIMTAGNNGGWNLDSSDSQAPAGRTVVSHNWVQVSGPQNLSITSTGLPGQFRTSAPSAAGEYVFRVTVQDSAGTSHQALVSRTVGASEAGSEAPATNAPATGGDTGNNSGTSTPDNTNGGTGMGDNTTGNTGSNTGSAPGASGGGGGALGSGFILALLAGLSLLRQASRNVVKAETASRGARN